MQAGRLSVQRDHPFPDVRYFCGGTCIEDESVHLMKHLSLHPRLRTCSADTILCAIEKLTVENITHTSESKKSYDFNTADDMNKLLINALLKAGQLEVGKEYNPDSDNLYIETEKFDAKPTYKKFLLVHSQMNYKFHCRFFMNFLHLAQKLFVFANGFPPLPFCIMQFVSWQ